MFDKLFSQKTYADQLGARLEGWRVQSYSPYRSNFRCPLCGDSQKNKFKKRGYILESKGFLVFHCHNACGTIGFDKFLSDNYPDIFAIYRLDLLKYSHLDQRNPSNEAPQESDNTTPLNVKIDLDNFEVNSEASRFVRGRQIPEEFWDDIYYTDKFYEFINSQIEDKFDSKWSDRIDKRIVLPLRWFNDEVFGVIGRATDKDNPLRYITIKFDDDKPKIFGLNNINRFEDIICVEGPIDSFFINNAVALAGTDGDPQQVFDVSQVIMALDNQPRARDVLKKYEKYIDLGYRMVIWPSKLTGKDPNEMILNKEVTSHELNSIIKKNTHSGVMLKIKFNSWRKN